jgi:hypothetical protein
MFVGAQLAHLGERAREARQRAGAALGFGALRGLDVMTADDDFDLRQFALHRAGDALDQRDPDRRGGSASAVDRGYGCRPTAACRWRRCAASSVRINRDRLGTDDHIAWQLLVCLRCAIAASRLRFRALRDFDFADFFAARWRAAFFAGDFFAFETLADTRFPAAGLATGLAGRVGITTSSSREGGTRDSRVSNWVARSSGAMTGAYGSQ